MLRNVVIIFSLISFYAFSQIANGSQRAEILNLIEKEIEVVKRSIHYAQSDQQMNLVRRLFNLYSEKMKVIRAKENEDFLKSNGNDRDKYFKESRELYARSYQEAMRILKNNPNFKDMGQFYYILALNDRDFFDGKKEVDFYHKALLNTKDPKLINEIKASLADSYYNKKKFDKAINYYEDLVKSSNLKWWTKYAYNLSWCYLKKKRFDQAKALMMRVSKKSLDKKFINFRGQSLTDLALFFAYSRSREEGINWFKENVDNPGLYIGKMAGFYIGRGDYSQAQNLLLQSLKTAKGKDRVEIQFKLLSVYEKSQQWNKHYSLLKQLEVNSIVVKDEVFRGQLTDSLKVSSNFYQEEIKLKGKREFFYKRSIDLVNMLVKHLPEERFETYYIWANVDIYFAEYQRGISHFQDAIKLENKNTENVSINDVYQKLFAALENGCELIKKCYEQKEIIYESYLKDYPEGKFAQDVRIAKIQINLDQNKMELARGDIKSFYKSFPKEKKVAVGFINQVLDFYTQSNNVDKLESWGKYAKSLGLEKDINIDGVRTVVSNIKFKKVVDEVKGKGNSQEALNKFIKIFNSSETASVVKRDAALNASAIALSIGSLFQSLNYGLKAIELMTNQEIASNRSNLSAVMNSLLQNAHFDKAELMANELSSKLCGNGIAVSLDNLIKISYFQKGTDITIGLIKKYSNCFDRSKQQQLYGGLLEDISYYEGLKGLSSYEDTFKSLGMGGVFSDRVMESYFSRDNPEYLSLVSRSLSSSSYRNQQRWRLRKEGQNISGKVKSFMSLEINGYITDNKFNEDIFQSKFFGVMEKLQLLDEKVKQLVSDMGSVQKKKMINLLIGSYDHFLKQIESIQVPGMPAEYVEAVMAEVNGVKQQVSSERSKLNISLDELNNEVNRKSSVKEKLPDPLRLMPTVIGDI